MKVLAKFVLQDDSLTGNSRLGFATLACYLASYLIPILYVFVDGREDYPGQVVHFLPHLTVTDERFDRIHPEWKVDAGFINNHLTAALRLDAKLSSHPIEVAVPDAGQIGQIFDSLSYSKAASGASVLVCQIRATKLMDAGSSSHAVEVRWGGQVPQRRVVVPQETPVFEYGLSKLVGRYWRSDWQARSESRGFSWLTRDARRT